MGAEVELEYYGSPTGQRHLGDYDVMPLTRHKLNVVLDGDGGGEANWIPIARPQFAYGDKSNITHLTVVVEIVSGAVEVASAPTGEDFAPENDPVAPPSGVTGVTISQQNYQSPYVKFALYPGQTLWVHAADASEVNLHFYRG